VPWCIMQKGRDAEVQIYRDEKMQVWKERGEVGRRGKRGQRSKGSAEVIN